MNDQVQIDQIVPNYCRTIKTIGMYSLQPKSIEHIHCKLKYLNKN